MLFLFILLGTVGMAGCAGANGSDTEEADSSAPARRVVRVETIEVQPTSFEDVVEVTGTVEADNDATLSAQTAGTVTSLVERGRVVRAGQTVAQLDAGISRAAVQQAEASVQAAQAQLDLAQDNFDRQQPLYRDSIISAIEFENARAQLNQARAGLGQSQAVLAQAREQFGNTRVVAPFTGSIEELYVERGEQVMPGAQIARIVSTDRVKITAGVPERYAGDIRLGTPVRVSFQAYGGEPRTGRITFIGSTVNPSNRTFPVEVELSNPERRFKPQMVAGLFIPRQQLSEVLVVPLNALVRDENGSSVFVVDQSREEPTATRRTVVVGPT